MEHLLSAWEEIRKQLQYARHILLLTDYDGTLTPIVERPELADIPDNTRQLLQALVRQRNITLGIISGRALTDLKQIINVSGMIYAGNHGFEIEGPGLNFVNPLAEEIRPFLRIVRQILTMSLRTIKGVLVEDKGLTLSVHYRKVEEEKTKDVKDIFEKVINGPMSSGVVRVTSGKKVYEVRPAVDWDKGKAIGLLMKRLGKGGRISGLLPIYLGDDLTDEDGFRTIEKYGNGISIFVGNPGFNTSARYYLESPAEVAMFFAMLLEYLQRGMLRGISNAKYYRFSSGKLV